MFRCPDCGDQMPTKFSKIHPILCRVASILIEPKVEKLLSDLNLD